MLVLLTRNMPNTQKSNVHYIIELFVMMLLYFIKLGDNYYLSIYHKMKKIKVWN